MDEPGLPFQVGVIAEILKDGELVGPQHRFDVWIGPQSRIAFGTGGKGFENIVVDLKFLAPGDTTGEWTGHNPWTTGCLCRDCRDERKETQE